MYTLHFLHFPFPLAQADLQELPIHSFVPQVDGEMPQQVRCGELVHSNSPAQGCSSSLHPFNANLDSISLQSPFLKTQSHAIKHVHFMQHSVVDAYSSK